MILCPAAPVNTEIDTNTAPDLTTNDMVRPGPAERSVFKELKFSDLQNYNYSTFEEYRQDNQYTDIC